MITIDVQRHGLVALDFVEAGTLRASRPAPQTPGRSVRVLVEVQRRFGGHAPRALLGAEFLPAPSTDIVFQVGYVAESDDSAAAFPGRLFEWPFAVGLPEEFAPAVLDALLADGAAWPAGVLRVDRAGYDEIESSAWVFGQAAGVLARALAAMLRGEDAEAGVRALVGTW
jgi:hypothetical protein